MSAEPQALSIRDNLLLSDISHSQINDAMGASSRYQQTLLVTLKKDEKARNAKPEPKINAGILSEKTKSIFRKLYRQNKRHMFQISCKKTYRERGRECVCVSILLGH